MASGDSGAPGGLPRQTTAEGLTGSLLAALRHEDVAAALDEGLGLFDAAGTGVECNPALRRLLGVAPAAHVSLTAPGLRLVDEQGDPLPLARSPFGLARDGGTPAPARLVGIATGRGDLRWVRMAALPADDLSRHVVVTCSDVTAERDAGLSLAAAENRLRLTDEHAPLGIALVSTDGLLVDVNDALGRLLGYGHDELIGRHISLLTHGDRVDLGPSVRLVDLLDPASEAFRTDQVFRTRDGREVPVTLSVAPARADGGAAHNLVVMVEDVSARVAATSVLEHRASHDQLTGLPNRALLLERTDAALTRLATAGGQVALLFCDLDEFKLVNDSRGHAAGDAVLVETARRLAQSVRSADVAARLGGDEFVVLCQDLSSRTEAEGVAQRLIDGLTAPMSSAGDVTMTVSIGVAFADHATTAADLLRNADAAMHLAKASGRDRYALFTPALVEQATERLTLEHQLREAMRTEALFLDFQPVRRLTDGTVASVESLVRWQHPTRGLLGPDAFLPVAEASDLILEIDRYVLPRACAAAVAWAADRPEAPGVSVNISARHVGRGRLPALVLGTLLETGLEPERLVVELTETALLGMTPTAQAELDTLAHFGVRIAIDDFGAGYSSLRHLVDVPASFVKIDRSFVSAMVGSPASTAVVSAVISLCQALGVSVVAEGIEDEPQRGMLAALGCTYGQGYLLGRPGRIDLTVLHPPA